jgi:FkbM family methyltransferase
MIGEVASAPFISYSANQEDVILNRLFSRQANGFFVDVGAAHPLFENDTRALYERGWRGINIEPNEGFFQQLAADRPGDVNLNLAVSDDPGEITFHEVKGTGLSTCSPTDAARAAEKGFEVVSHTVETATLRVILADHAATQIDLLKVDVEGFELKVIASNDWDRFRPRVIVAEGTYPESPARRVDGVAAYLADRGYRHAYFDGLNDFYLEQGFAPAPEVFDRPPNIFDHFVPLAQHLLEQARSSLAEEVESLRQERQSAMTYIASLKAGLDGQTSLAAALQDELARAAAHAASLQAELTSVIEQAAAERERAGRKLASLQSRLQSAHNDLRNARSEGAAMRDRGSALAAEMEALAARQMLTERAHLASLTAKSAELSAMSAALQSQEEVLASMSSALKLKSDELDVHSRELRHVSAALSAMLASTSWRITRPMRALARPRRTLSILLGERHENG